MVGDLEDLLAQGRAALHACDWAAARSCFDKAVELDAVPEALDGLGQARYWQGDYAEALRLRQRAYAGYRERGDTHAAVLVAVRLAQLHGLVYGNATAVSGWIGHALRLLEDCGDCVERGWVELMQGCICSDPRERERRSHLAAEVGRRFPCPDLEYDALAYLGKARVESGAVRGGMALVDEAVAAVAAGVVSDAWAAGEIYCTLFHACEIALDLTRAEDWLQAVDGYVERTGELPISAICRMHYGGLLAAAGRWADAERELATSCAIYDDTYRGTRHEPLLRLADLRVRQRRLEEAGRLLDGLEDSPAAAPALARLLLARGEPERARAVLDRHVPPGACPLPLAPALALRIDAALELGAVEAARADASELARLAEATGLASWRGLAARARARVAAGEAGGEGEAAGEAAAHLEAAMAAFREAELGYELAATRLEHARLVADGDPEGARAEARQALEAFARLGATADADAAGALLRRLGERGRSWPRGEGTLTARQREVLALLADGLSNAEIAARLYISPRTAEHHVSNILATLGLRSRAEAGAYALRRAAGGP